MAKATKKAAKPSKAKVKSKPAAKKINKPVAKKIKPAKSSKKEKVQKAILKKEKPTASSSKKEKAVKPMAVAKPSAPVVVKPVKETKKSKTELKEEQELTTDDAYSWSSGSFSEMKNYEPTGGFRRPDPPQPKFKGKQDDRTRYTDKELDEFRSIIMDKIKEAEKDYVLLKNTLSHRDEQGTDDTSPTFKVLEDGSDAMSREEVAQLASRQEKHIQNLKNALVRIENKTYGICRVTGKLIPKERLRSVPHATLSIEAKLIQNS
jgi:DnaK suppressor protein